MYRIPSRLLGLLIGAILLVPSWTEAQRGQAGRQRPQVTDEELNHTEYMVAMRDGVRLATSVYLPEGEGPWPVLIQRTPYNKRAPSAGSRRYTQNGYAYVDVPRSRTVTST